MSGQEAILKAHAVAAVGLAASAMAERGEGLPTCPSCGHPVIGTFCGVCGQSRDSHRRSVRHLVSEFVQDIASFDGRIARTVTALLLRPGELAAAFREGRTQRYVPPVRLYLFVSLLFFLLLPATGLTFVQFGLKAQVTVYSHDASGRVFMTRNGTTSAVPELKSDAQGTMSAVDPKSGFQVPAEKADGKTTSCLLTSSIRFFQPIHAPEPTATPDAAKALAQLRAEVAKDSKQGNWITRVLERTISNLATDPGALNAPLAAWIPRILFVLLPLFAGLVALLHWSQRKTYFFVDHLVFSLTMHSFAFVALFAAALAAQIIAGEWVALGLVLGVSAYFLLSLKAFYRQNWFWTGVKFAGISVTYFVVCLAPALMVAVAASAIEG